MLGRFATALRDVPGRAGDAFDVVVVSIDPHDTPQRSREAKQRYAARYGSGGEGWHFLTGNDAAIHALAQAAGFRYLFDPMRNTFVHAAGVFYIDRGGIVRGHVEGTEFTAASLAAASRGARIGMEPSVRRARHRQRRAFGGGHRDAARRHRRRADRRRRLGRVARRQGGLRAMNDQPANGFDFSVPAATTLAPSIDGLFYTLLALSLLATLAIVAAIFYFCVKYRAGSTADRSGPRATRAHDRIRLDRGAATVVPDRVRVVGRALCAYLHAAAEHDGHLHRGQAVDVESAARQRTPGNRRSARAARRSGAAGDDLAGRDPCLLRSGVPAQAGRAARPLYRTLVSGDESGRVSVVVHGISAARIMRGWAARSSSMPQEDYERWSAQKPPAAKETTHL